MTHPDTYNQYSFGFLTIVTYDGGGWFRIFGKGLSWKDVTKHELLFSERYGYAKRYVIGKWSIKLLKP